MFVECKEFFLWFLKYDKVRFNCSWFLKYLVIFLNINRQKLFLPYSVNKRLTS